MVVLGADRPATLIIVLKIPIFDQTTVVVLVFILKLSDFGPVIIFRTIVLVKPPVKKMMLVRCFGKVKSIIALAVPHILPNLGFDIVTVKVLGSIGGQAGAECKCGAEYRCNDLLHIIHPPYS